MLFQAVIGACFESTEDFCVFPLSLVVAPGMCHKRKAEQSADALSILLEEPTFELGPVVCNDTVGDPKSIDNRLEEGNNSILGDVDHRGSLWPLCELVDGDEEETALADNPGKWSQDVHPPYGEWPGGWNHLQSLSQCVYLLCMELACFVGLYHLSCILESCWPVKTMPEGLTNQCAGC
jgi:hypothetical protein